MDADISILSEHEVAGGWTFDVVVGPDQRCSLKLSFADYNHWSGSGTDAPSQVARAVVRFMLDRMEEESLPSSFDAALTRRRFSEADEVIPRLIR